MQDAGLGGLPVPLYNHLRNLDKRWATRENLEKAYEKWKEYKDEVSSWKEHLPWPADFTL